MHVEHHARIFFLIMLIFSYGELMSNSSCVGCHTIGFVHCGEFLNRIYNFSRTSQTDPTMNPGFAQQLRLSCPHVNLDPNVVVFLDQTTPKIFDNTYYKNTVKGEGILTTDQELFTDLQTRPQVEQYALSNSLFVNDYISVITKMGNLGVLTGTQGEIRRALDCASVN
jgi:peroxidase